MATNHGSDKKEHILLTADQTRDATASKAIINKISDLSPTVKGYDLKLESSSSILTFKAGQWVDFFIPGVEMIGGFSMCGPPSTVEKCNQLNLAVKYSDWPPANWLHRTAKVGDEVAVRIGGDFHYPDETTDQLGVHDVLLIAGGVGINPLASIFFHIHDIKAQGDDRCRKIHLLFSAKSKKELLFLKEMEDIVNTSPDFFSMECITTREDGVQNSRIDGNKIAQTLSSKFPDKTNLVCYLCGPPQMIRERTADLLDHGLPSRNVKYELWW